MYTHSGVGRLLANAKIEEARYRLITGPALRTASLERGARAVTVRAAMDRCTLEAPAAGDTRRWLARLATPWANERSVRAPQR